MTIIRTTAETGLSERDAQHGYMDGDTVSDTVRNVPAEVDAGTT